MGCFLAGGVLEPDGYRVIGSTVGFDDSHVVVLVTASGRKRPRLTLEALQFLTRMLAIIRKRRFWGLSPRRTAGYCAIFRKWP
jgi:hypothetical protein